MPKAIERLLRTPVTRSFFPERIPIRALYFCHASAVFCAPAPRGLQRGLERSLSRCRARQEHPVFVLSGAPEAPRSGAVLRFRRIDLHAADLRAAAPVPLPEAPLPADSAHGGGGSPGETDRWGQVHR